MILAILVSVTVGAFASGAPLWFSEAESACNTLRARPIAMSERVPARLFFLLFFLFVFFFSAIDARTCCKVPQAVLIGSSSEVTVVSL